MDLHKILTKLLNQITWNKCLKQVFVEREMLEMFGQVLGVKMLGVYSDMLEQNDGAFGFQNVLNSLMLLVEYVLSKGL